MQPARISLEGGPWNGRWIEDSGKVVIRMAVSRRWLGQRPAPGALTGLAHYEPNEDRSRAFFSHNQWDGTTVATYDT